MPKAVVTVLGKDRPGIIAEIARVLFEKGGNIEDSSMTILQGEFAMILIVSIPEGMTLHELRRGLIDIEGSMDLEVHLKGLREEETRRADLSQSQPYMITILGFDHPGIVYRVSRTLADRKINISDMNTKVLHEAKGSVYAMALEVEVPVDFDVVRLREDLAVLGKELHVDVTLNPIESLEL
jgi:glycine cleavage system transcriptional repressor